MALRRGDFVFTPSGTLGDTNTLLCARARQHFVDDFAGPLSIKYVVQGRVYWKTGRDELWVDESSFLILNRGEPYSLSIDGPEDVETCCAFFRTGFVESVARCLVTREEHLLDDPFRAPCSIPFISRLHHSEGKLVRTLTALRNCALSREFADSAEDQFVTLGEQLLGLYEEMRSCVSRLPASRASTRLELLKRTERGREFLHANPASSASLAQTAAAACLSSYHFHRTFRLLFGKTPHAYHVSLRLERARRLLQGGMPVTEVCFASGFESLGSFSNLFRKRFGQPPSKIRKNQ